MYAEQADLKAEAEAVQAPSQRVKYIYNCTQVCAAPRLALRRCRC